MVGARRVTVPVAGSMRCRPPEPLAVASTVPSASMARPVTVALTVATWVGAPPSGNGTLHTTVFGVAVIAR